MTGKSLSITMISLLLGVIISWQYKSVVDNRKLQNNENIRLEDLKDEIITEKKNNEDLRKIVTQLEKERLDVERDMGDRGLIENNLKKELAIARLVAGLTDVKGKGIEVELDHTFDGQVTDADILSVINELRASEAQAISVNDYRIVASSEIRKGGNYIIVNGRQVSRPFIIKAIADPDKLENALKMVGGVAETLGFYGIKYTIEKKEEIFIPKVDSTVIRTDYLNVVE